MPIKIVKSLRRSLTFWVIALLILACFWDLNSHNRIPEASAATINAASCSQANVQSAINSAQNNDTVLVPAGNCTWSGMSLAKPIHLQGAGVGKTNITISNNSITKQGSGIIRISNFSFSKSGGGNESKGFEVGGSWKGTEPVIFQDNAFIISNSGLFLIDVAGGVIIARNNFTGGWDDSFLQITRAQDTESWSTADTMGMRDTTGKLNHYIEDNTFYGGTNQGIDADNASRVVYRHNTLTYSSFNTHGFSTSPQGVRHFEVYNNQFLHNGGTNQIANQNWAIWIRGATGVIYDNYFDNLAGQYWGDKAEIKLTIRGAEDVRPQGSCSNVSYPVPHQLGQNYNGTSYFTDPIYFWGNTGATAIDADWNWGNPCGFNFNDFFQWGRDAVNNSSLKPGYVPYTYPHPLLAGSSTPPPSDTTAPSTPGNLAATPASSTQISLSWSASTDNIGVTGYKMERCQGTSCTNFAEIGTAATTSFQSTGLSASTTYRFRVRATDAAGNLSSYSSIVSATTTSGSSGAPPALLEGNTGIAAQFPNDTNIQNSPNVIFADGFETYASASGLTSSGNYNNYFQGSNITFDTSTFFGGSKALKLRMPSTGNEVSNAVVKDLSPRDTLFMRVYTRFQPNYSGLVDAHNGLRITGNYSGPGQKPDGTDFFLVNIENSRYLNEGQPGYTHAYVYHPEQDDFYGEHWYSDGTVSNGTQSFGQYFVARPKTIPNRGEWISYEVMVQLNTPGVRDGRVAVWQNGNLIADWQNIRFRDVSSLKIDQIQLENGGKSSSQTNDKWYDNLVLASSYIGPVSISSSPIVGDVNLDHIVNSIDYSILNSHWFTNDPTSDLNHDGLVNAIDYSLLNSNWFKTW